MNADASQPRDTTELDRFFQPVLDVAVVVAREWCSDAGPSGVPPMLRPFLKVSRLPRAGLHAARLALEDDPALRAEVAERVAEADVGRGPWLWVTRPPGWRDDLEGEWELWQDQQRQKAAADAERSSARQLERATDTAQRLAARVEQLESALGGAQAALAEARAEAAQSAVERDRANAEAQRLAGERAEAVRQLKHIEELLAARTAELREVEDLLAEEPPVVADPTAPPAEVVEAVRQGAVTLESLVRSFQRLSELVGVDYTQPAAGAVGEVARRRPVRVGRGIPAESTAAAEVLLAQPGAVVFVDGYNLTMAVWPSLTVTDQRRALERAATSLAVRTGAEVHLVFDGDGGGGSPSRSAGSAVRIRFTAAEVEADDEILDLIATVPIDRPVIVVSDDRRVQSGARRRGANVVGSRQLQPLLLR